MKIIQNDRVIFSQVRRADTFALRLLGLLPRRELGPQEGLLLQDCSRIHTNFMRFTIDVIYLSEDFTVLDTETVRPWRVGKKVKGARHVLETAENGAARLTRGERISTEE